MRLRSRASRRYARAVFETAEADGTVDGVASDLAELKRTVTNSPELAAFLPNYLVPAAVRQATLAALWSERLHPLTWRLVRLLEAKRRLGLLEDVCGEFAQLNEARQGIVRAHLASAFPMPADEVADIAARAGTRLGRRLTLETSENRELLGGYCLRVGDRIYDLSLAARMRMLRQTMTAGCGQGN